MNLSSFSRQMKHLRRSIVGLDNFYISNMLNEIL